MFVLHFTLNPKINIKVFSYFFWILTFFHLFCHKNTFPDLLHGLRHLNRLNLSNNSITEIRHGFLPQSLQLKSIDLSHNLITTLSVNLAQGLSTVNEINLSHNRIYIINSLGGKTKWHHLDLSFNQLKVLADVSFVDFPELQTLDVSINNLVNVERDTFAGLSMLRQLDLSGNELQGVMIKLPESLEELHMGNNSLRLWPIEDTPKNLTYLDVHGNELNEIFMGQETVANLKVKC